jgi:hypothetical protein
VASERVSGVMAIPIGWVPEEAVVVVDPVEVSMILILFVLKLAT